MANCAECVHVEVCKDYINAVLGDVDESQMCGDDCEFYKDRSRFVELPCKVGDTIYWNLLGKPVEDEIMSITIYKNVIRVSFGKGISFDIKDIGRMLFLSREKKKKKLTEHEKTSGE